MDPYAYVRHNPLRYTDPSGMTGETIWGDWGPYGNGDPNCQMREGHTNDAASDSSNSDSSNNARPTRSGRGGRRFSGGSALDASFNNSTGDAMLRNADNQARIRQAEQDFVSAGGYDPTGSRPFANDHANNVSPAPSSDLRYTPAQSGKPDGDWVTFVDNTLLRGDTPPPSQQPQPFELVPPPGLDFNQLGEGEQNRIWIYTRVLGGSLGLTIMHHTWFVIVTDDGSLLGQRSGPGTRLFAGYPDGVERSDPLVLGAGDGYDTVDRASQFHTEPLSDQQVAAIWAAANSYGDAPEMYTAWPWFTRRDDHACNSMTSGLLEAGGIDWPFGWGLHPGRNQPIHY